MEKKITIGLFNDTYFPFVDGVVMVVDNYARRLTKIANVVVFVPSIPGEEFDDNSLPYKVVRCQSFKVPFSDYSCSTPDFTLNFKKKLDECKLDIIHIHSPFGMGIYAYNYARKHNIPTVCTLHTQFDQNFIRLTKSKKVSQEIVKALINLYNKCDECWTVNVAMAKTLCNSYGYKKVPIIINNSTDLIPTNDIKKSRDNINKKYKLKNNENIFLFVGRINKLKNILFIVDVLRILKNENFKFKMLFVGTGQDEKMLRDYVSNNDLDKEVIMCGKVTDRDELRDLYVRANLFLFPSLYDTNSLVQIEAASQSTPTVFIESATSSTVTNMINGFITKDNPIEYADMIIKVLKDKKLYNKVSKNAYKDLYKSWDDVVKEVYERYINLINKNR